MSSFSRSICRACKARTGRDSICEVNNEERRFCNRACQRQYYIVWTRPPSPSPSVQKSSSSIPVTHNFPQGSGFSVDIEAATMVNPFFRRELWTLPGSHQVMAMCITPEERDIGLERHAESQFFRVEAGRGRALVNGESILLSPGTAFTVAPNTEHNVMVEEGATESLSLYTIYMPPHHAPGTFHARKSDAIRAEEQKRKQ